MARGIRFVPNMDGYRAVHIQPGVRAELLKRAERIAARANGMVSEDKMRNDAFMAVDASTASEGRAVVFTASPHGVNAQNKSNVLLKSLDAGR